MCSLPSFPPYLPSATLTPLLGALKAWEPFQGLFISAACGRGRARSWQGTRGLQMGTSHIRMWGRQDCVGEEISGMGGSGDAAAAQGPMRDSGLCHASPNCSTWP